MALLLGVSLGSLLIAGILSWLRIRSTSQEQIFAQLTSIRASKGNEIESYMQSLRAHLETLSEDRMVVSAMVEFNLAYKELQDEIIPREWQKKIEGYYKQEFLPRLSKNIKGEQIVASYRPTTQAGQYLQYYYIAKNSFAVGEKEKLTDAQDGSDYSKLHAKYHPIFRNLSQKFGYYDLFLIDIKTGEIIYSVDKETDYATSLDRGAYRRSNLAQVVEAVRDNLSPGFVQVVDFQPYAPSYAAPAVFFAAPIYNGPHVVGILAIQLPVDEINHILTSNQNWERDGLGKTGEVYLVGSDLLMRSVSRFLIEDAKEYEASLRKAGLSTQTIDLIKQLDTSILLQPVNNQAVQSAIGGVSQTTIVDDYRGISVLSSSAPLKIKGLKWGILAQMNRSEALEPVSALQTYLIILAAIVILLMTWLSNLIAQNFVKPIQALINAASQLKEGKEKVEVKVNSQDEFGELGQAFNSMVQDLGTRSELMEQKSLENEALLLNILPSSVAERVRQGEAQIADSVPQATVLFARIVGITQLARNKSAQEITTILNRLVNVFDEKAQQYGLDKENTVGTTYVTVCGLSKTYLDHPERTVNFAREMLEALPSINQEYQVDISLRIGINSGSVMAGIVGTQKFAYKLWGETVNVAANLNTKTGTNTILVTPAVRERLQEQYLFVRYQSVEVEDSAQIPTWILVTPTGAFSQQVDLVQSSFSQLLSQADATAKLFYERLFEMAPAVRPMFKEDMAQQRKKFIDMLQIAVNGLSNLDKLLPTVQNLGRRHVGYGVKPEQYETVGEAFLWALEQKLGEDFTPEVKRAWISAYTLLSGVMLEAASSANDKQPMTNNQ